MNKKGPVKLNSREVARSIAQSAYDVKAVELVVLDLRKLSSFTDFFVIASGHSDRQVQAICDRIEKNLGLKKSTLIGIEGYPQGHWILMDYGSVVAHIFYEEVRVHYGLESLWAEAPRVKFRLQ